MESFEIKIVGVTFNGRQEICEMISVGDSLELVREPNNYYDPYAVKVMFMGRQCGYIPKEYSYRVSKYIDEQKKYLQVTVTKKTGGGDFNIGLVVNIDEKYPDKYEFSPDDDNEKINVPESQNKVSDTIDSYFESICNSIISATPPDPQYLSSAFYNVANEYSRNEIYIIAIRLYEVAARYNNNDPSIFNNMASCYKYLGDLESAKLLYIHCIKISPDYMDAYLRLSFLFAYEGDSKRALECFNIYEDGNVYNRRSVVESLKTEIANGDVSLGGQELLYLLEAK